MSFDDYFDNDGLLVTMPDQDGGDSAQMMGLLRFGQYIKYKNDPEMLGRLQGRFNQELDILTHVELVKDKDDTIIKSIPHPGTYVRHPGLGKWWANPKTFSRDQQRSIVMAMGAMKLKKKLFQIFWNHIKRFGFYQNTEDFDGTKKPLADFASPDHWGEYIRAFYMSGLKFFILLWPLLLFTDLFALIGLLLCFPSWDSNPDDADDDNLIMHTLQAKSMPTPISWLTRWLYFKYRSVAGYKEDLKITPLKTIHKKNGPLSAVTWKHRTATGSPPFAGLYADVFKKEGLYDKT